MWNTSATSMLLWIRANRGGGGRGPFKNQKVIRLRYRDAARFSQQVGRYFAVFGRENVHVIIYDDFKLNPSNVYRQLLDFLQVSSGSEIDHAVINANRRARSMAVQDFLRHPPRHVRRLVACGQHWWVAYTN